MPTLRWADAGDPPLLTPCFLPTGSANVLLSWSRSQSAWRSCDCIRWRALRTAACSMTEKPAAVDYGVCPKIAMFDECPGMIFAFGLIRCTALFTAIHASAAPTAMSLSFPGYVVMSPAA